LPASKLDEPDISLDFSIKRGDFPHENRRDESRSNIILFIIYLVKLKLFLGLE
jgi:hypothetical protein